jgi:putative ABC transport system permease protein
MFRNYLTVALRNIVRHKLYSFINIAGLAVGLACVIFIMLFVRDELSYDKWMPDSGNLYRLEGTVLIPGRPPLAMAVIQFPLPQAMKDQIPEVTGMTRVWPEGMTLTVDGRRFFEHVNVVDPGFFRVIKLPLISGDPSQVFRQPESIVLSETAARKYFGTADPMGKIMVTDAACPLGHTGCTDRTVSLKVTGIMRDIPHSSQLSGDVFIPNTSLADKYRQEDKREWLEENGWGYVTLAPGTDPRTVIAKTAPILDEAMTGEFRKFGINRTGSEANRIHLTPFTQVHLTSDRWMYNMTPPGSWTTLYGVGAIGLLVMLVACFNFMNLATARAMLRAREIALRKTLGAGRGQIIAQFLGESVLTALLALVFALAIVEILLPAFDGFLQRPIAFHYLADWPLLLSVVAVAVAAGLLSGSYPALVLSGFRPASVLRTNSSGQSGSGRLRAVLVVVQFAISIGLGICAVGVLSQINFARNIALGFRHDNVLIVHGGGRITADMRESFVQTLRGNPGVLDIAGSDFSPFDNGQSTVPVQTPGQSETIGLNQIRISPNFPRFYGIRLVAGRLLSDSRSQDRMNSALILSGNPANEGHNLLINEAAAARLGLTPQQAVGRTILYNHNHVRVVGVLADAKFAGAREPVKPTSYVYDPAAPVELAVRLRADTIPQTLNFIDKSWRAFAPTAIERHFLDDSFGKLYQADERQGEMFGVFVGIAIFIACLGLFGLAAFTAGRRTKEIGIRKVFGARSRDVVLLLLWQFSIPVLIANAVAWPVAWYYLHDWLQGFAYRITLSPLYFVSAGLLALVIAWVTIFAHALRVARANPVHALRTE